MAGRGTTTFEHTPNLALLSTPGDSPARDPGSGTGQVQTVLRLGYGPRGPATPRRPVADVLDFV